MRFCADLFSRILCVFLLLGGLLSCVEEVQLPPRSVASRLVVEGLITNEAPPYSVKLTFTGAYNSLLYGQNEIPVEGAAVSITEVGGRTVQLQQDPITPFFYWQRDPAFVGTVGKSYQLTVELADGTRYVSEPEPLLDVPAIDRIYAEYRPRTADDFADPDYYEVLLDTKDPAEPGNYYRWSAYGYVPRFSTGEPRGFAGVCCQYCYYPIYGSGSDVQSDALVNGKAITRRPVHASPIYYPGQHFIEVRQYSLTRAAYQFWTRFEEQRKRTGSLFDPLPASIEGNVHSADDPNRLALGYFGASAVSTKRMIIPGDTLRVPRIEIKYGTEFVKDGNCQRVYSQGQLAKPEGW